MLARNNNTILNSGFLMAGSIFVADRHSINYLIMVGIKKEAWMASLESMIICTGL